MVKNPSSNAGNVGSIPGWGPNSPHAAGQLSPCATSKEPTSSELMFHNRRSPLHTITRASPCAKNEDPVQTKIVLKRAWRMVAFTFEKFSLPQLKKQSQKSFQKHKHFRCLLYIMSFHNPKNNHECS